MLYQPRARVGCQQLCKAQEKPLHNDCLILSLKAKTRLSPGPSTFLLVQLFIVHWQVPFNGKVKGMSFKWSCLHVFSSHLWSVGLALILRDSARDEGAHSPLATESFRLPNWGKIALHSSVVFLSVIPNQCILSFTSINPLCLPQLHYISLSLFLLFLYCPPLLSFIWCFRSEPHHPVCLCWQVCLISRARLGGAPTHGSGISWPFKCLSRRSTSVACPLTFSSAF